MRPLGLVHWQASWPMSHPSGQDVSLSEKSPARVAICCRKGDPFQGPTLGSCLTLRNELSKETHVQTKQETLFGKAPGWSTVGKGTQEDCSASGSQSWVLW